VAAARTAFRIHSDLLPGDLAIAARTLFASSGRSLNCIKMARFSDFGTLGLPSLAFISIFSITEIIVDRNHTFSNTFSQQRKASMANKLQFDKKVMVISMLCEGSSIRAIERITGVNRNTIMNLGVRVGQECIRIQNAKMRSIQSSEIQIDEIWGFVGAKRKNAAKAGAYGDVWICRLSPELVTGGRQGIG
jgi:hypothetical protein